MAKIVELSQNIASFLSSLLQSSSVDAIITLKSLKLKEDKPKVVHALLPKGSDTSNLMSDFPVMPVNAGKVIPILTLKSACLKPMAAFLRPCEIRALVELVKLKQAHMDNLYIIGLECGGVYPLKKMVNRNGTFSLEPYLDALRRGEIPQNIRPTCQSCDLFQPLHADVIASVVGREKPTLAFVTEKGLELASKLELKLNDGEIYTPISQELLEKRKAKKEELVRKMKGKVHGYDGLLEVFGMCIGCHCCSHVCPICYCKDCFFESKTFDYAPLSYTQRVDKKGTIRIPMDTTLFHLGRMTHMATSCVACGMCEDLCPMDIPLAQVFKVIGADLQTLFEYLPGRNIQEELPLTTFKPDELKELEN